MERLRSGATVNGAGRPCFKDGSDEPLLANNKTSQVYGSQPVAVVSFNPTPQTCHDLAQEPTGGWFAQLAGHLGPAFVVSVAYVDPGNFATNLSAGAAFGYSLLWVVLLANVLAVFLQCQSAKLGIATGKHLPDNCASVFSKRVNWVLWSFAAVAAMATDLAEFLGAVLGFQLLLGLGYVPGALLTAVLSYALAAQKRAAQRSVEFVIALFIGAIAVAYFIEIFLAKPDWASATRGSLVPSLPKPMATSLQLAVGILGATVMPHVIYLHSDLVLHRRPTHATVEECQRHYRWEKVDIVTAMNSAFLVNAAMVVVAACVFHTSGTKSNGAPVAVLNSASITIPQAAASLGPLLGSLATRAFGVALLLSGLSSATVGTISGEVILNGFVGLRLSPVARRLFTMGPALVVLFSGCDVMAALVLSQVVLSFALPAAVVPLVLLCGRRDLMGEAMCNHRITTATGWLVVFVIISLNLLLVLFSATGFGS